MLALGVACAAHGSRAGQRERENRDVPVVTFG
jgi:hypothetical protein